MAIIVEETTFKGVPVLCLKRDVVSDRYAFQFNLVKAKLILECQEEIIAFVKRCEAKKAFEKADKQVLEIEK